MIFVWLTGISPTFNRFLWKKWYNFLALHDPERLLSSMNYGFLPVGNGAESGKSPVDVVPQLELYEYVISDADINGKVVIEVGAGRGGGALYLSEKYNPLLYIGLDLAKNASVDCASLKQNSNLTFVAGDALQIPLKKHVADVLINIESSHCYSSIETFIEEVACVLKPGGYFCYCDLMPVSQVAMMKSQLASHDMHVLRAKDVTCNIMASLNRISDRNTDMIRKKVPWYLKRSFSDFAGIQHTGVYNLFESGKLVYYFFLAKRLQVS